MSRYLIRDALPTDLPACLALDHSFETDYVWQMALRSDTDRHDISFQTERLPRTLTAAHPVDESRLRTCLDPAHCFLVGAAHETQEADSDAPMPPQVIAYLTMRYDPIRRAGWVQDLVVDPALRRQGIGGRLLGIARRWAVEQGAGRLFVEVPTQNYPMIALCLKQGLEFSGYNDRLLPRRDIALLLGISL